MLELGLLIVWFEGLEADWVFSFMGRKFLDFGRSYGNGLKEVLAKWHYA